MSKSNSNNTPPAAAPGVRMVIQRYRQCSLTTVVDDDDKTTTRSTTMKVQTVGSWQDEWLLHPPSTSSSSSSCCGLLVYVSFGTSTTSSKISQAAKTLLQLPVATVGAWGSDDDDGKPSSLVALALQQQRNNNNNIISLTIVPQANLISKIKSGEKSIQYHGQADKTKSRQFYAEFVTCVRRWLIQVQEQGSISALEQHAKTSTTTATAAAWIPPHDFFALAPAYAGKYTDDRDSTTGLPTHTIVEHGVHQPITKSASKRLTKALAAHTMRHENYLQQKAQGKVEEETATLEKEQPTDFVLDPSFVTLLVGSFGYRQGVSIQSDMGPFCHVYNV